MNRPSSTRGWRCAGGWLALVLFHLVASSRTHREHKVHNIVLYPGKHSWCKTTPIKQVVAWPGCVAKEIDNNVCVGACFSYTIPQTQPSAPGDVISPYCDSCQASEVSWMEVTLECQSTEESDSKLPEGGTESPPSELHNATRPVTHMKKKVQMISNCSCSSCHGHHGHGHHAAQVGQQQHHEAESPDELLHQQHDVPELMGLVQEIQTRKMAGAGGSHSASHLHLRANNHTLHQFLVNTNLSEGDIVHQFGSPEDTAEDEEETVALPEVNVAAESLSLPISAIEHPSASAKSGEASQQQQPQHEGAHPHPHHTHHHHGYHHATHLEVAHEKLHPAHEGAEVSYHENLVNPEQDPQPDAHDEHKDAAF